MIDIIVDILSIISLSGFSRFAESLVSKLAFPKVLAAFPITEAILFIIMFALAVYPQNLIICLKDLSRSFILKIHPKAVVPIRYGKRVLPRSEVDYSINLFLYTFAFQMVIAFIISFQAASISEAMLVSTAIVANSGWLLLLAGKTAILAAYTPAMRLILALLLIPRKIILIFYITRKKRNQK